MKQLWKTIQGEFSAIFQKRMQAIALIAIMFIPVLYTGTYLYAFKDPYSQLDRLPVAVVNLDQGAEHDGEKLTIGQDFVEKLKEKDNFQWHFVSDGQAQEGLRNQKYYMVIRIPADFSKNATTLTEEHPKHLELEYIPNKAYNFLAAQIGNSAVEKIKEEVSASIVETYAEDLFAGVKTANEGFAKAYDGADELYNGLKKLADGALTFTEKMAEAADGSNKIAAGMATFDEKNSELNAGAHKLETGAAALAEKTPAVQQGLGTLAGGLSQLEQDGYKPLYENAQKIQGGIQQAAAGAEQAAAGTKQLHAGTVSLETGAGELAVQLQQLHGGAQQTAAGAQTVHDGLAELKKQVEAMPEPYRSQLLPAVAGLEAGSAQVQAGAQQVSSGSGQLAVGAGKLQTGLQTVNTQLPKLYEGQLQLADGLKQVEQGQTAWLAGFGQFGQKLGTASAGANALTQQTQPYFAGVPALYTGLTALTTGSDQLTEGAHTLQEKTGSLAAGLQKLEGGADGIQDGADQLSDGSGQLASGLQDGVEETGKVQGDEEKYEMMAQPVELKTKDFGQVANYGTGVSPYFISLGLYVGALLLSVVYPLREAAGIARSGLSWFASKLAVVLLVGTVQSLVIDWIVMKGLNIEVQSTWRFMLLAWITSIAFLTLIQFLVTTLGDVGRFVAIIILVLQLTTSGGTYPLEMVAPVLQKAAHFIPMTYSVNAFKAAIASGDYSYMWSNARILGLWAIASATGTAICFTLLYRRYFRRLQQAE